MKALSLVEPWAVLIFAPKPYTKMYETRGWYTSYRGELAIHSSGRASFDRQGAEQLCLRWPFNRALARMGCQIGADLPFGAIVGVVDLVDCIGTSSTRGMSLIQNLSSTEEAFGDFSEGRFMWQLENPRRLAQPIPCRGALGLWEISDTVSVEIKRQLGAGLL